MAMTEKYANFDLATGLNDGTSEANAWQTWGDMVPAAGERINNKRTASRKSIGSVSQAVAGTTGSPVWLRGYTDTIGDGGILQLTAQVTGSGNHSIYENIDVLNASAFQRAWVVSGKGSLCFRCLGETTDANGTNAFQLTDSAMVSCRAKNASASATDNNAAVQLIRSSASYSKIIGSGNQAAMISDLGNAGGDVLNNIINGNGDIGLLINTPHDDSKVSGYNHNTIYNCSDAIHLKTAPDVGDFLVILISDNILYSCSGFGINNADVTPDWNCIHVIGNAMGALTSGRINQFADYEEMEGIVLTADPFTNAAGGDFSLNNIAGGGALCRAGSVFNAFPGGLTTGFNDIGAVQHEDTGGGGNGNGDTSNTVKRIIYSRRIV